MSNTEKLIVSRRCDKQMRRRKQLLNTPFHRRWRCTGDCKHCICCIEVDSMGDEYHHRDRESHAKKNGEF